MKTKVALKRSTLVAIVAVSVTGCVSAEQAALYSDPQAGFTTVSANASAATFGRQTVWIQNQQQARESAAKVKALVNQKTISADTAVQIALFNNRGLQASYAELGMSAADAWQQTMLENPVLSVGLLGVGAPEIGVYRAIEATIATNIVALTTQKRRVAAADVRFRQAQYAAVGETLRLAVETRRAWIAAVSAQENVRYLEKAQLSANAAAELGQKLGDTGALPKAEQAREQAFYAEISGQLAEARLAARLAKEELTRLMGLWGSDVEYRIPERLPSLPATPANRPRIEADALRNRADLKVAKLELEALAQSYKLTEATRYVSDLEMVLGAEAEREIETEYELVDGEIEEKNTKNTVITPQIEVDFAIPIFDTGKARMRKAELAYLQAANRLAERAVNVRSEARSAYTAYRSTYDIAIHYKSTVIPLRSEVEKESLLTYNGMITNTFELLADIRSKVSAILMASNAKREFWLADANLSASVYGGGASSVQPGGGPALADAGGSPH